MAEQVSHPIVEITDFKSDKKGNRDIAIFVNGSLVRRERGHRADLWKAMKETAAAIAQALGTEAQETTMNYHFEDRDAFIEFPPVSDHDLRLAMDGNTYFTPYFVQRMANEIIINREKG